MSLRSRVGWAGFAATLCVAAPAAAQQQTHTAAEFFVLPNHAADTVGIRPAPMARDGARAVLGAPAPTARRTAYPSPRAAQSTPADETRARARFEAGVRFADSLQWSEAADAFEESYRLFPRPATLRNLALAHRALGRYTRAIDELERFVAEAHPEGDVAAQVNQIITEMRGQLATVTIVPSVSSAQITLDNQPVRANEEIHTDPGNHVLAATASGYARTGQTFTIQRGDTRRIDLRLERSGGGILSQWWFWTAVGVVVAGGAAATIVLLSHEEAPNCGTLGVCVSPQ